MQMKRKKEMKYRKMNKNIKGTMNTCETCKKTFKNKGNYKKHLNMKKKCGSEKEIFKCKCGKSFGSNKVNYTRHTEVCKFVVNEGDDKTDEMETTNTENQNQGDDNTCDMESGKTEKVCKYCEKTFHERREYKLHRKECKKAYKEKLAATGNKNEQSTKENETEQNESLVKVNNRL